MPRRRRDAAARRRSAASRRPALQPVTIRPPSSTTPQQQRDDARPALEAVIPGGLVLVHRGARSGWTALAAFRRLGRDVCLSVSVVTGLSAVGARVDRVAATAAGCRRWSVVQLDRRAAAVQPALEMRRDFSVTSKLSSDADVDAAVRAPTRRPSPWRFPAASACTLPLVVSQRRSGRRRPTPCQSRRRRWSSRASTPPRQSRAAARRRWSCGRRPCPISAVDDDQAVGVGHVDERALRRAT